MDRRWILVAYVAIAAVAVLAISYFSGREVIRSTVEREVTNVEREVHGPLCRRLPRDRDDCRALLGRLILSASAGQRKDLDRLLAAPSRARIRREVARAVRGREAEADRRRREVAKRRAQQRRRGGPAPAERPTPRGADPFPLPPAAPADPFPVPRAAPPNPPAPAPARPRTRPRPPAADGQEPPARGGPKHRDAKKQKEKKEKKEKKEHRHGPPDGRGKPGGQEGKPEKPEKP